MYPELVQALQDAGFLTEGDDADPAAEIFRVIELLTEGIVDSDVFDSMTDAEALKFRAIYTIVRLPTT